MTDLTAYAGVDWVAMAMTFVAIYLLGNQARMGFVLMMVGNACWMVVAIQADSLAMLAANAVFAVMNLRGWWRWGATDGGASG